MPPQRAAKVAAGLGVRLTRGRCEAFEPHLRMSPRLARWFKPRLGSHPAAAASLQSGSNSRAFGSPVSSPFMRVDFPRLDHPPQTAGPNSVSTSLVRNSSSLNGSNIARTRRRPDRTLEPPGPAAPIVSIQSEDLDVSMRVGTNCRDDSRSGRRHHCRRRVRRIRLS